MPACYLSGEPDHERRAKFDALPQWEEVTWQTERLRVEGGWLYRVENHRHEYALTFAPDTSK